MLCQVPPFLYQVAPILPYFESFSLSKLVQVCLAGVAPKEDRKYSEGEIKCFKRAMTDPSYPLVVEFLGQLPGGRWLVRMEGKEDREDVAKFLVGFGFLATGAIPPATALTFRAAPPPPHLWDPNWDQGLTNRMRASWIKASRTLILIRHGQYSLAGKTDKERILTSLGRSQADMTGSRLAELSLPYTHIIRSNMSRAVETADLISAHLPHVKLLPTDKILREGSPITPQGNCWTDGPWLEAASRKVCSSLIQQMI